MEVLALDPRISIPALLALCRPLNCLITALSVWVGAFAAGSRWPFPEIGWAALAAALIAGAGNAFNDVVDLEIDRINRPRRPLPSGRLSRAAALAESGCLATGGAAIALWLGPETGAIALAVTLLLGLYSLYLKRSALWGNLLVSGVAAVAFPYGALAAGTLGRSWVPAGFAFLFHLGREILKDLEDVEGDRAAGARTLPLRLGLRASARLAASIYLLLIAFTLVPWMSGIYGWSYLALVAGVDSVAGYAIWRLLRDPQVPADASLSRLLKVGMLLGLLAVVAGEAG